MSQPLPKECAEYIDALPPAWQNNARSIVRQNMQRILRLNPITASNLMMGKYGIYLDPDRTAYDYSGEKVINNQD